MRVDQTRFNKLLEVTMPEYNNANRIALWRNDKREKLTHPHLKGKGETSVPVWANAWFAKDIKDEDKKTLMEIVKRHNKTSDLPFISISLQLQDKAVYAPAPAPKDDFVDSDIPF